MEQPRTPDDASDQPGAPAQTRSEPRRPLAKRWVALPLVAAAGLALAVGVLPPSIGASSDTPSSSSTVSAAATLAPSSAPSAAETVPAPKASTPAPGPAAAKPTALSFPAAKIDMAVLPLTPSEADLATQTLVPPLTIDAYWLTSYGIPGAGSNNTTYIAGHSWDGRDAPFNALSEESLVGAEFTLTVETGDLTYVVDSVTTHDKDTLKDSDIWNIVPNRVVLISCYTEDPWGKNVVVTAMPKTA
ncbi:sortase [Arthrobacter pityocampae]|uniref:Sortase n=1 Tax=Arthrobacter pityocampae TaxID=547334 RepID=A0A2S5IUK1_9MICC|nr:class F sortase [Arthrobacter pityocampae]PPB48216.1 sortase [Arthrobacter pityocampae]